MKHITLYADNKYDCGNFRELFYNNGLAEGLDWDLCTEDALGMKKPYIMIYGVALDYDRAVKYFEGLEG